MGPKNQRWICSHWNGKKSKSTTWKENVLKVCLGLLPGTGCFGHCDFEASSIILSHLVDVGNVSLWVYIEVGICFCAMPTNLLDLLPFKWGRCYGWRSEIPPKVLMWTEISQDLDHRSSGSVGCTCDVLTQLTAISSGGYIKELQFPCSVFFFFFVFGTAAYTCLVSTHRDCRLASSRVFESELWETDEDA